MASSSILLVLLFPLLALAVLLALAAYKFLSIDRWSSNSFTDANLIEWVGDDAFVQSGKSQVVQIPNGISQEMATLRVFTTRKKNCYSIDAEKGAQFLVRGSFYYGNYDKKSAPPSFDVLLDGNLLDTIQTTAEDAVYFEVIYVATRGSIYTYALLNLSLTSFHLYRRLRSGA